MSFALLTDPSNDVVHMLRPAGDGSLCGHFRARSVRQIDNFRRADDVTCAACWALMMEDFHYRRRMRTRNLTLKREGLSAWQPG